VIASQPINYAIAFVFSRHEFDLNTLLNNANPRQTISYRRGNTFGGKITKLQKHNLFEVNTDEQSFGLLDNGRVDYIITYMPDVRDLIVRADDQQVFYNPAQAFHIQDDSLLCHQTKKNQEFIKQINEAISTLKASGELHNILGKSYIQPN
jgi:ABC-type amino acid transport substrate-binding protein